MGAVGPRSARRRRRAGRLGLYLVAALFVGFAAAPFEVAIVDALKENTELYTYGLSPFWFLYQPTFSHVSFLFTDTPFVRFCLNTLLVGALTVAITLVLALPAAYSLARLRLRFGGGLAVAIFMVYLVPPSLLFISMSQVVAFLGLQDTVWSMVVVYPTVTTPVAVWLLLGFFKAIPVDIEEQAMVDGYSRGQAFLRVLLPLTYPGIVAVVIFAFTLAAGEFIYALAFVSASDAKTVSIGVPTELVRGDVFFWQSLLASVVIVAVPIALVFNLFLNRFIAGFTQGSVKG
ncbi:carbohydrate ABC transporter permease [Pseudonocardia hispaniensis]|uniref:Carbohydrate ABC transporter permease n=1 Tax=Pseudonocardia hispaniensis TaxID=904933 RepID=A0ABW1J1K2_9PSEU